MADIVVEDFKIDGRWLTSYRSGKNGCITRSYRLWCSMTQRLNEGVHKTHPTYVGVKVNFTDFNEFAEWCQSQYGLMNKDENGRFWNIDKDILGGKEYSKETCIFVPSHINSFFTNRINHRGAYPLGVTLSSKNAKRKFTSRVNWGPDYRKTMGYFETTELAHKAWQLGKIERLKEVINGEDIKDHHKLKARLLQISDFLQYQHDHDIETKDVLKEINSWV